MAKWKSVVTHVFNIHSSHDDPVFCECSLGKLKGREAKKWLKPATKEATKLEAGLTSKTLLKDVANLIIQFAPKSVVFSFQAMKIYFF